MFLLPRRDGVPILQDTSQILDKILSRVNAGEEGYQGRVWYDEASASDMMVYGTNGKITAWVAYMADDNKKQRIDWVGGLNFWLGCRSSTVEPGP